MAIQWFPGHMHLTRKAIAERVPDIDVVIELLDARMPGSSANPLLAELTAGKPSLKVLNKQDIADPARTATWLAHYNGLSATSAIGLDAGQAAPAQYIVRACHALAPQRSGMAKPMRVLICGVPNVGKSTLVNTLAGRRKAKTGDEAGITRLEQRIVLADDFYLWDTPGMLWPRIALPQSGFRLAACGSIGRNAYDEEEVALELIAAVKQPYAQLLQHRFRLIEPGADAPQDPNAPDLLAAIGTMPDEALLEAVGRKRGAVRSGGRIDMQKAAEAVLNEFRGAVWGRITLETPEEFLQWQIEAVQADAERTARKEARKQRVPKT